MFKKTYLANSSRSGINVILIDLEANGHQKSILPASKNGIRHKIINMAFNSMFSDILHSLLLTGLYYMFVIYL